MKTLPAIETLRPVWEQQFEALEHGGAFRHDPAVPAAPVITSPYDPDARNGKKRTTYWTGYKVHFTQTCDDEAPQLITHVATTAAPLSDERVVSRIHDAHQDQILAKRLQGVSQPALVYRDNPTLTHLVPQRADAGALCRSCS